MKAGSDQRHENHLTGEYEDLYKPGDVHLPALKRPAVLIGEQGWRQLRMAGVRR